MLAESLYEWIEVRGSWEAKPHLTDAAVAHAFGAVLPTRFGISVVGRGERTRASLAHLRFRPRFVLENVTPAARIRPTAQVLDYVTDKDRIGSEGPGKAIKGIKVAQGIKEAAEAGGSTRTRSTTSSESATAPRSPPIR